MTNVTIDSCGLKYTNVANRWANIANVSVGVNANGHTGIIGAPSGGTCDKIVPAGNEFFVGFNFTSHDQLQNGDIIEILNSGSGDIAAKITSGSGYLVASGYATGNTASFTPVLDTEAYIELHVKVDPTGGSGGTITFKVNGSVIGTVTGQTISAGTTCDTIRMLCGNGAGDGAFYTWFNNFYVNDPTGSENNTFNGLSVVGAISPTAPGSSTEWTPSTGANWAAVATNASTGTPDVSSSTVGNVDTYATGGLPAGLLALQAVQMVVDAKYVNGATQIAPVLGNGAATNVGTSVSPASTFTNYEQTYNTNPLTSTAWALGDFSTLQIGIKQTA